MQNEDAEFSIVVADAWQRCGLGIKLMQNLINAAKQAGVVRLNDVTLSTNLPMLARIFHHNIFCSSNWSAGAKK